MGANEPDAGEASETMQSRRLVTPNNLINERRAGHEQNANKGKEGSVERRQLADCGERVEWAIEAVEPAVAYPHGADDERQAEDAPVQVARGKGPTTG